MNKDCLHQVGGLTSIETQEMGCTYSSMMMFAAQSGPRFSMKVWTS